MHALHARTTHQPAIVFVPSVLSAGVSTGVSPPGPVFRVTECVQSAHVFTDARHSILLGSSLLIRSGVEQNPGPPKTRQAKLDQNGRILSGPEESHTEHSRDRQDEGQTDRA